jgi:hypothetical protein
MMNMVGKMSTVIELEVGCRLGTSTLAGKFTIKDTMSIKFLSTKLATHRSATCRQATATG